ncbi:hypothetical protein PRIPAC_93459 [Pristionchus pacificus]|uniref:Uncharacterized protein n=1 Tax=Pristionchus pacificus TaxID=54126 RepID=A0A2A6BQ93_PRIPA|nr:hypothetical protein PRIPAC_93459 [Pristionchus pacificus]|eukprot:PDM68057.1 hypothetical protein PRIPAC_46101 [Pristionchus pacificus]
MSKLYSICREREREDLLKQRSIEKSTKEQWLKELTDIMNRLGVKSNVKEAHKQITHIQEESAKYKLLSESMMAQMERDELEMQRKRFEDAQKSLMAQINGEKQRYEQELLRNETDENRRNGSAPRSLIASDSSAEPVDHSSSTLIDSSIGSDGVAVSSNNKCSSSVRGEEYNRNKNDKRRGHREQYPQRTNDNVTLLQAIGGTFIQLKPFDHKTEKFDEFMERFNIKYRGHSDIMIGSALGESDSFPNKV